MNITITAAAQSYITATLAKTNAIGFRLSVKKTGCSGYSYVPSVIETIIPTDIVIEAAPNLKIFIDATWRDFLQHTQIDYVEENHSVLKQKRLVFTNTKESARCGCGESFQILEG